jgi:hypothetical protein
VRDDRPSGSTAPPAVWMRYAPDRKAVHPAEHLTGFSDVLQADGYAGFERLYETGRITKPACWAHAPEAPPMKQEVAATCHNAPSRRVQPDIEPWRRQVPTRESTSRRRWAQGSPSARGAPTVIDRRSSLFAIRIDKRFPPTKRKRAKP